MLELLTLFPLTVLLVSVKVPELMMPPPKAAALFPLTVLLVSVKVPKFRIPPPSPPFFLHCEWLLR